MPQTNAVASSTAQLSSASNMTQEQTEIQENQGTSSRDLEATPGPSQVRKTNMVALQQGHLFPQPSPKVIKFECDSPKVSH